MPRGRTRLLLGTTLLASAALFAAAVVASRWWKLQWLDEGREHTETIMLSGGRLWWMSIGIGTDNTSIPRVVEAPSWMQRRSRSSGPAIFDPEPYPGHFQEMQRLPARMYSAGPLGYLWRTTWDNKGACMIAWPVPVAFAALGLWPLRSGLRALRRARSGLCKSCAYDLAGVGAGAPCPECGAGRGGERSTGEGPENTPAQAHAAGDGAATAPVGP